MCFAAPKNDQIEKNLTKVALESGTSELNSDLPVLGGHGPRHRLGLVDALHQGKTDGRVAVEGDHLGFGVWRGSHQREHRFDAHPRAWKL